MVTDLLTRLGFRGIRRRYLIANNWELWVCLLGIVASINYVIQPENLSDSSVGHMRFPDAIWNLLYGIGSVMVVAGLLRLSPRLEIAGLWLFSAAVAINLLAIGHYRGWSISAATLATLGGLLIASIARIIDVWQSFVRRSE